MESQEKHESVCWALWPSLSINDLSIEKSIDHMLSGYLFYPENEWPIYGYRPPDKDLLIGSWRNDEADVFIFLIECVRTKYKEKHYLLYATGDISYIKTIKNKVKALKSLFIKTDYKELKSKQAVAKLDDEKNFKPINRIIKIIGIFTIVVNAFSLYLRKLPIPDLLNYTYLIIYKTLLISIHILALVLLFIIIIICIVYVLKYAILILKRF